MTNAAATAGMLVPDDSRTFIIYIAAATGIDAQTLVCRDMDIAAAAGLYIAFLCRQVITVKITPAAGTHRQLGRRAADIAVRSAALCDRQVPHRQFPLQITAA